MTTEAAASGLVGLIRSDGAPAQLVAREGCCAVVDGVFDDRDQLVRDTAAEAAASDAELVLAA